ncbi:MAG: helix-turn-helix domain-containing protein [Verrucomicrobiales bacterium]|nr:helix-turn-helix domain-containing protein [Verrucomicrobiales bacterium]
MSQQPKASLFERLRTSDLFQVYRDAFQAATGLPLLLKPADQSADEAPRDTFRNAFCAELNSGRKPCQHCLNADQCLTARSEQQAHTTRCFAGLKETAIPVRAGGQTIAFLSTGQCFDHTPGEGDFDSLTAALRESGFPDNRIERLRGSFFATQIVDPERYQGMVTLIGVFALQLSESLNRLMIEDANSEPPVVISAKQYINANLEERITLDDVAAHVCVSPYYFCKIFKQATGMTLTEYVNRRRIERAKRKLLVPHARVTEVAYDVGYQSLSQFNRSFLKYVGMSPTQYREHSAMEMTPKAA